MNEYHLFYTEDRLDEDAPNAKVILTFEDQSIEEAVAFVTDKYHAEIGVDLVTEIEDELERATLTWTDPKGFEAYYVIERVAEEGSE
jgi:superfamily I DNA and/or RNA helicase